VWGLETSAGAKKDSLKYELFRRTNWNAIIQSVTDSFSFR